MALINADWIKHRVRGVAWAPATDTSVIPVANAGLAQLVAQLTCNQWVSGSSPEAGTIFFAPMTELVDVRVLETRV